MKNEDIGIPGKEKEKRSWEVGKGYSRKVLFLNHLRKKITVEILNVIARDKS